MSIEYYDRFLKLHGTEHPDGFRFRSPKDCKEALQKFMDGMKDEDGVVLDPFSRRDQYVQRYAWAVPSEAALAVIAQYSPIIEIGAGGGYWAMLLRERDATIVPFDNHATHQHPDCKQWVDVAHGGPEILEGYPGQEKHALMLCWPPMSSMAADALKRYQGETLIYIGEGSGGCNADDEFFSMLEAWEASRAVLIPRWEFIHDTLTIYKRRNDGNLARSTARDDAQSEDHAGSA